MTIQEKILDLSIIWNQVSFVFPHFLTCNLNWNEQYAIFIEKTMKTETDQEHALLMAEFVNALGDGHTDISFAKELRDKAGYFPFELEYLKEGYCLNGQPILRIDAMDMEDICKKAGEYIYGVNGFLPRLEYILPFLLDGTEHTIETVANSIPFRMLSQKPLPSRKSETEFILHGSILQIKFSDMLCNRQQEFFEKLKEYQPRAVILDVRENIGGMTKLGADIAQLFLNGTFGGCRKWTRKMLGVEYASASQMMGEGQIQAKKIMDLADFEEYEDQWGAVGQEAVFTGPVVLLTSRKTVSAAEDFVAFFRSNKRATVIGTSTCGTSGTPLLKKLSCGTLRVCSVGYCLKDGTHWIGKGIQPDIWVEQTAWGRRNGVDEVLEKALEYLA